MRKSVISILLVVTSTAFGQSDQTKLKMHNNAKAMRQEIEMRIPTGSSIQDAKRTMEANGFTCARKEQNSFVEMNDDKSVVEHNNIDFLFCDKSQTFFIDTRLWQVALVHKNGVVSDIFESVAKAPVLHRKDYIHMSDSDIRSVLLKYAPLGSSEDEVKRVLRHVFHRGYKKNTHYKEDPCYSCPTGTGGFTIESHMQHYDYLRNFFLSVDYVLSIWYFDKNGVLRAVWVSHEWDGV